MNVFTVSWTVGLLLLTSPIPQDDALVYQATGRVIDLVLGVLLSILIILLYLAIISPSVRNMVACGEGTEQMLRSIPEDIVRKVPAIASYLQIAGSEAVEVPSAHGLQPRLCFGCC